MTNKERIQEFYVSDDLRNPEKLSQILHEDVILDWDSSEGKLIMQKPAILNLAKELRNNYTNSFIDITHLVAEGDFVTIRYLHKVSAIENPNEIVDFVKMIVIWEFLNDKLIRGYQISQPA
uniref:nuclear transport factor 2 family protein n=1 Tax=Flavobacterium sp. TaxID=239 RepID=UPI00404A13AB